MRNIVQRYMLETSSEQDFAIHDNTARYQTDRPDNTAFDIAGRPGELDLGNWANPTHWLAHLRYLIVS